MTALVPLDTLGAEIRARLEAGDKALGRAEDHYLAAGLQLVGARRRVEADGRSFRDFLAEHQIGKSRAYDLIAVAEGKKTFAGIRAKTAERVARHAERGREAMVSATNGHAVAEEPAAAQPADADELQRLRAENERLAKEIETLKKDMEKAKAELTNQKETASLNLGRAQRAEEQRDAAQRHLLYANADKDRLTAELSEAREEIAKLKARPAASPVRRGIMAAPLPSYQKWREGGVEPVEKFDPSRLEFLNPMRGAAQLA